MTLYLKYRPQKVSELGQVSVRETLGKILASKALPHAFLFIGSRGTGKTSSARILAKTINNDEAILTSPDVVEIDAASNRGIDEIRALRENIALAPMHAKYKVYIIDEVHMLTAEAFNALLKTLEEPPVHAMFVLCTTESAKLPETVVSRCTVVHFTKPSLEEILIKLKLIAEQESIRVEEQELLKIAQAAKGSFRDAIKLLESFQMTGNLLDSYESQSFLDILGDTPQALKFIASLTDRGVNIRDFIESCIEELRLKLLATQDKKIIDLIQRFEVAYVQSRDSAISQLPLEILVIEASNTPLPAAVPPRLGGTKEGVQKPKPKSSGRFSLTDIEAKWGEILKAVKPHNHSVEALLHSTRPTDFDGDMLHLEVFYKFHKDKLETDKCKSIIENSVGEVMGIDPVRLILKLGEKAPKTEVDIVKAAEEIFKASAV